MQTNLPKHFRIGLQVLLFLGERLSQSLHKTLMSLSKRKLAVAYPHLFETVLIQPFPRQVHQSEVVEQRTK